MIPETRASVTCKSSLHLELCLGVKVTSSSSPSANFALCCWRFATEFVFYFLRIFRAKKSSGSSFKGQPRLPHFARPRRYEIELTPHLQACKFDGKVAISLDIVEATKFIVFNAAVLSIHKHSISVRIAENKVANPSSVTIDAEDEIVVLEFAETLPVNAATLFIDFQGILNDQMKGFYRSTYVLNGERRNMAVTQFEPTDARRCFPCWDEPSYKANFKITVKVPTNRVVLSNMPAVNENIDGNLKSVTFQESPIMSTYLVAIVVGEFDYIEDTTTEGKKVRVYTEVGKTNQGKFALDVAARTLKYYAEYFGMEYPLPKLDMIVIPDFSAGAMENYGLVTYRETALLYDEKHSSAANKQRVAIVVTHELAHQWFGNLVTMEWWTHLWLNEGFATWVSYLATDYLFPEWNIWTQFNDQTMEALKLDGLVESHPIEVDIRHAQEINEIFDAISYKKGASIIRMLQSYLGAKPFQEGLKSYIKRYAWKNARTEDLWAVLSEESAEPVNELMDSWTKEKGYPFIFAKIDGRQLNLEQSQYLSSGMTGSGKWVVPITFCYGSYGIQKSLLLRAKYESVSLSGLKTSVSQLDWIKLNVKQTAFYRVQYDDELSKRLRAAIAAGSLDASDRFGILYDSYALCSACKQPLSALLSLMDVFRNELDYSVLSCLIDISYKVQGTINDAISGSAADFKLFVIGLLQFVAKKLGWDRSPYESHLDSMLREQILRVLAEFGHSETKQEALKRFNVFVNDRNTPLLPADIRKAVYTSVMQDVRPSDKSLYHTLLKIYRETDLSQEKVRILSSIASCPHLSITREALDFSLTSEVRSQDAFIVVSGVRRECRDVAWQWLQENWDSIWKSLGSGFLVPRFISAVAALFSSEEKATEFQAFFSSRMQPSIARTVSQSIEEIGIKGKWVKNVEQDKGLQGLIKDLVSHN